MLVHPNWSCPAMYRYCFGWKVVGLTDTIQVLIENAWVAEWQTQGT